MSSSPFWSISSNRSTSDISKSTVYDTPDLLWASCCEYFEFCESNPLVQNVHTFVQGSLSTGTVEKPRAMSMTAMLRFIGMTKHEWTKLKNGDLTFTRACNMAEDVVTTQLYELGAADILNANFVARAIGMADKQVVSGAGPNGEHMMVSQLDVSGLDMEQLDALQSALIASLQPAASS